MGKKGTSGGKGGRGGQTDTGKQLGKQEDAKNRARAAAQRTRLQRALAKAEALPLDCSDSDGKAKALLAVHQDAVATYREYASVASGGGEWVQAERLKHMSAIFDLAPDGECAQALREEFVLLLLDEGEAARARKVLEGLGAQDKTKAVFAWSLALVELVAWKGGEEGASEELCRAAVKEALKTNVYIGIFLSNLDCYTREIDPTLAPGISGRQGKSVEEALAYCCCAAGCWMDFDEDGSVTKVVGEGLEAVDVVWPPVSEGKTDKYLRLFLDATEIAEREADECDSAEDDENIESEGKEEEEEEEEEEENDDEEDQGGDAKRQKV
jgi:hypothetical protein